MDQNKRKLRTCDIRPLTDSRDPLPQCPVLHIDAEIPPPGEVCRPELFPKFRNSKISGFKEAKCDARGFKEAQRKQSTAMEYTAFSG